MNAKATDEINNKDLVLYALYVVGGAKGPVHTEDVAHQLFQYTLGKRRYRWDKYDYPDKERVARELRRLKDFSGTSYVRGHVNIGAKKDRIDGWILTPAGVERAKALKGYLPRLLEEGDGKTSRYEDQVLRDRITQSVCYRLYLEHGDLKRAQVHHFTDLLYCFPDAPAERLRTALEDLVVEAKAADATDLVDFLEAVRTRFESLLEGNSDG